MPALHTDDTPSGLRAALDARWPPWRQRLGSAGLALALEALLLLVLLTLGQGISGPAETGESLTSVTFAPERSSPEPEIEEETETETERAASPAASAAPQAASAERPRPSPLTPTPVPRPSPAAVLPVTPSTPAPAPASPAAPAKIGVRMRDAASGPAGSAGASSSGDSQVVGTGPNGEPVYAARWYREPSNAELRGYLSTVGDPGWAIINCKTASGWRVENCYLLDQYPDPGNMGRAVLAAAWQFQVRPPVKGGKSLVGEWVRIRITYEMRRL